MCINYRYCVIVVPSINDFASKMADKPLSTQMVVKLLTDDANGRWTTDGQMFSIAKAHTFANNVHQQHILYTGCA